MSLQFIYMSPSLSGLTVGVPFVYGISKDIKDFAEEILNSKLFFFSLVSWGFLRRNNEFNGFFSAFNKYLRQ